MLSSTTALTPLLFELKTSAPGAKPNDAIEVLSKIEEPERDDPE
jgi:hypothetical protein